MESQPQNPEFRINPENFHSCTIFISRLWCDYADSQVHLSSCLLLVLKKYPNLIS